MPAIRRFKLVAKVRDYEREPCGAKVAGVDLQSMRFCLWWCCDVVCQLVKRIGFTGLLSASVRLAPAFAAALLCVGCGGDDERPADWDYIAPVIVRPNCATISCHSEAAAVAGLDLSTPEKAYESLLEQDAEFVVAGQDRDGCENIDDDFQRCQASRPMVTPGVPGQSRVVQMMRAVGAQRMPPDRPLPEADIALIERWILEGATCDSCGGDE